MSVPHRNSGHISFVPGLVGADVDQRREKVETTDAQRLAALRPQVRGWSGRLALDDLAAMDVIARQYEREALTAVQMTSSDIAGSLRVSKQDAEARLSRLIAAGAVEETHPMGAPNRLRPVARSTADRERTVKAVQEITRAGDAVVRAVAKMAAPPPKPAPVTKVDVAGALPVDLARGLLGARRRA